MPEDGLAAACLPDTFSVRPTVPISPTPMSRPHSPSTPDARSTAVCAIRRALEGMLSDCARGRLETPEPTALAEEIERVGEVVAAHAAAHEPPRLPPERADRVGILDVLRARILDEPWAEADGGELLLAMRAIEAARETLSDTASAPLAPGVLTPYGHRLLREVAHTLRSPLGSVVMLSGMLKDGSSGEVNDLQRKHLGIIHRAAVSLASMASDLLGMTGEEDGFDGGPESLSIDAVLSAVADAVAPVAEDRNLSFTVRTEREGTRLGRPVPLERVLLNLSLNAALLAREGALEMGAEAGDGDEVIFSVAAAPVDVEPDALFRVFETPGPEADYTLSRSGLGLSIARRLVHRMGSELRVECTPGRGLRLAFALRLPPHP